MLAQALIDCGAVLFGEFTLTSGAQSNYYVDIKKATSRPDVLRRIGSEMARKVGDAEVLAGMALGAVPIAVATSLESGLPYAIVRKEARTHGTGRAVEGHDVAGRRVLVVEDVATTGGSLIKAIQALREQDARIRRAVTVVDRQEGATQALARIDVQLEALATRDELLAKA